MKKLFLIIALFALPTVVNADEIFNSMGKLAAQVYMQNAAAEDVRLI